MALPVAAQHLGVHGQTYAVIEPDMLALIERKARDFVDSGRYEQWKEESIARARATIETPPPVDLQKAVTRRERLFDPATIVPEDITDLEGNVLIRAGTRVNPLDYMPPIEPLVIFDGREPAQVAWAEGVLKEQGGKAVLTGGSWVTLSRRFGKQVYFDMGGWITRRFGIDSVPALVRQSGRLLTILEVPVVAAAHE